MEEWQKHIHLSLGKCFEMYFIEFDATIRFKVTGTNSDTLRKAKNCSTGEAFEFYVVRLLKKEYATLNEVNCTEC